jgi:CMP-2-keto-3-deoxyoctulosonic acid synthetase|tara:strand:+ start:718 stop:987 length:270 start_codon:yes stop_codon:yes gene_type:complete
MEDTQMINSKYQEEYRHRPFATDHGNDRVLKAVKKINASEAQRVIDVLNDIVINDAIIKAFSKESVEVSKPNLLDIQYRFNSVPVTLGS